jgi:hypothetical protein
MMLGMEAGRTRWTDDRMDDLALGLREELRELHAELAALRSDTNAGFRDTNAGFRAVYAEIGLTRRWMAGLWFTTVLGFVALLVELQLR